MTTILSSAQYLFSPALTTTAADPETENIHLRAHLAQAIHLLGQLAKTGTDYQTDYIYITTCRRLQKIYFRDIWWIEAERNYIIIGTALEDFVVKWSISKIMDQLPRTQFSRIHKSYVVANTKVDFIDKDQVGIKCESKLKILPLGAQFKKSFIDSIEHLMLKSRVVH